MSKTSCPRCGNEGHRGRCKKSELQSVTAAPEPEAEEPTSEQLLEIEPSMGARLKIGPDRIEIEQDRKADDGEFYTYTITLYPHEARQVIDRIASWVEKAA